MSKNEKRSYNQDQQVCIAANIMILKKVWTIYFNSKKSQTKITIDDFYQDIGLKKGTVEKIMSLETTLPKSFQAEEIAQKYKMNKEVFTGDYLIQINGDFMREFNSEDIYNRAKEFSKNDDISEIEKHIQEDNINKCIDRMNKGEKVITEKALWREVMNYKLENKKKQKEVTRPEDYEFTWITLKRCMLEDVVKQTKEEDFMDDQLWKFWNYIRKI